MRTLFTDSFIHAVCRLRISARSAAPVGRTGEHISRRAGAGIEFRDYRAYAPGDDLRRVDWNIYRRSRRLFLRLAEEPRELPVHVLLDASDSMFFEQPPRADAGRQVAAALAAAAVHQHDRAAVYPLGHALGRPLRLAGSPGLPALLTKLADLGPSGRTDLAGAVRAFASLKPPRGLVAIVSDFFDPGGIDGVLDAMGTLPHRLVLAQLTRRTDRDPGLSGDLELLDCETNAPILTTVTPAELRAYQAAYDAFESKLHAFALRRRAALISIDCDAPILPQMDRLFPGGILRV